MVLSSVAISCEHGPGPRANTSIPSNICITHDAAAPLCSTTILMTTSQIATAVTVVVFVDEEDDEMPR